MLLYGRFYPDSDYKRSHVVKKQTGTEDTEKTER